VTDAPTEREDVGAWAKLRRRKVVQWGLAYAAGSWVLLQVLGFAAAQGRAARPCFGAPMTRPVVAPAQG
jgi:hypothetical protein